MNTKYKHIFFDLDHTIWDFDKNAEETLQELYLTYKLHALGLPSATEFIDTYTRNNHQLWADYHVGKISKETLRETRFKKTFLDLGLSYDLIPLQFEDDYVRTCPTKTNLFEGAHQTLQYLRGKYTLHLITNGFKESQELKLKGADIVQYFDQIIVSEDVGFNKPDPAIFRYALNVAGADKETSIMIGDSIEADIRGALAFGMDAIYFNPAGLEKPADVPVQITSLNDLTFVVMSIASDKRSLENALAEYRRKLDQIPDDRFNAMPPGGGWSYGEVYSHILQSNLGSLIAIERCANGTGKIDNKRLSWLAQFIFLIGGFPIKFKAPEKIAAMVNNIGKEEARNLLVKLKAKIDLMAPVVAKASTFSKIKHPRLGLLNAKQWLTFIDIHTRHHLKQLKRIENKFQSK